MEHNEYKCAACQGVFEKTWSEEAATSEMKANFGAEVAVEDCDIVCDDCYKRIMEPLNN